MVQDRDVVADHLNEIMYILLNSGNSSVLGLFGVIFCTLNNISTHKCGPSASAELLAAAFSWTVW